MTSRNRLLFGIDESGKGDLAGPMVVCAFTHPEPTALLRMGARDSKLTTAADRHAFHEALMWDGRASWDLAVADAWWIDQCGHEAAIHQKLYSAVDDLLAQVGVRGREVHLLIDGRSEPPRLPPGLTYTCLVGGDGLEPLIGAASMLARHHLDRFWQAEATRWPDWNFARHQGRTCREHAETLYRLGPTRLHRQRPSRTAVTTYARKTGQPLPSWAQEEPTLVV